MLPYYTEQFYYNKIMMIWHLEAVPREDEKSKTEQQSVRIRAFIGWVSFHSKPPDHKLSCHCKNCYRKAVLKRVKVIEYPCDSRGHEETLQYVYPAAVQTRRGGCCLNLVNLSCEPFVCVGTIDGELLQKDGTGASPLATRL